MSEQLGGNEQDSHNFKLDRRQMKRDLLDFFHVVVDEAWDRYTDEEIIETHLKEVASYKGMSHEELLHMLRIEKR